uniref:Uncharacterized protein n=1 Tax=Cacopsylla melanoneura TaxID=428564 RepID=A0A8D9BUM6_9HEMI
MMDSKASTGAMLHLYVHMFLTVPYGGQSTTCIKINSRECFLTTSLICSSSVCLVPWVGSLPLSLPTLLTRYELVCKFKEQTPCYKHASCSGLKKACGCFPRVSQLAWCNLLCLVSPLSWDMKLSNVSVSSQSTNIKSGGRRF